MSKEIIADVLAERYASSPMVAIWSPRSKTIFMRELWIAVLKAQDELGLKAPEGAIEAYERVIDEIYFDSIKIRESKAGHDVKAHIEEFSALAGFEAIHRGMTSRDVTDNVEQMQIRRSVELIRDKLITVLVKLGYRSTEFSQLAMAGRSHNVAAQMTTLGKRFANVGEEMLQALERIEHWLDRYPLRGIKGPMGTSADQLELLGSQEVVDELEDRVALVLGFNKVMHSVGQIYPRSLDFEVGSMMMQAASGVSNLAITTRLMAGYELATEGFKEGRVGSSAMPHKMNASRSERKNSLMKVLRGFTFMLGELAGDQWQEADVSCSVVRRVALQGTFFAMDGMLETALTILNEFGAYPMVIEREIKRYMPFLVTTKVLAGAIKRGVGREVAHEVIKEHSVAVALDMREKGLEQNDLFARLANDGRLNMTESDILELVGQPIELTGNAVGQVEWFVDQVHALADKYPDAVAYEPEPIL